MKFYFLVIAFIAHIIPSRPWSTKPLLPLKEKLFPFSAGTVNPLPFDLEKPSEAFFPLHGLISTAMAHFPATCNLLLSSAVKYPLNGT